MTPTDGALPDLPAAIRTLTRTDRLRPIEIMAREEIPRVTPHVTCSVLNAVGVSNAAALTPRELEKAKEAP